MSLRQETTLIADGRRLSSRAIVLQSLSSVPCFAFRKVILPVQNSHFDDRLDEVWGGLGVATDMHEHAVDYEALGHCMLMLNNFMGGYTNDIAVGFDDVLVEGQVEPYDLNLTHRERLYHLPNWTPQKGDLFCLLLGEGNYLYLECVGKNGSSLMADFGVKYLFNQKFDLSFLDSLDTDFINDKNALDWQ